MAPKLDIKALFSKGTDEAGQDSESDPSLEAARDILTAIRSGKAEALDLALRDHYEACQHSSDTEEPEETPSED